MEIQEKVRINVVADGKTFQKTVTVTSDGCYNKVDAIVKSYVNSVWGNKGFKIQKIFWNYT